MYAGGGLNGYGYFYLENSYSTSKVNTLGDCAGGLIGKSNTVGVGSSNGGIGRTYVNNCFSTGQISGNNKVGGIIGELLRSTKDQGPGSSYIYITNIYTIGKVLGESNFEPILGSYTETTEGKGKLAVSNVYWVPETTGLEDSTYGIMKNLENMFYAKQFSTFEFNTIWKIDEGKSIPYLLNLDKPDIVNRENIIY